MHTVVHTHIHIMHLHMLIIMIIIHNFKDLEKSRSFIKYSGIHVKYEFFSSKTINFIIWDVASFFYCF